MVERVTISEVGHAGDGVAETPQGAVFVPFTLAGEVADIERDGERGRLRTLVSPSAERATPACRHFGACGGCALQHWQSAPYLAWKEAGVATALGQRGISATIRPIRAIGPGERRRAVFTAVRRSDRVVLGFARRGSEEILPLAECPVTAPAIVAALPLLAAIAGKALSQSERAHVAVTFVDNGLDISIDGKRPSPALLATLLAFAGERTIARLTLGGETVFQNEQPQIAIDPASPGTRLFPPPGAFLQAAARAEAALAEAVLEAVGSDGPFADLFCGVGTFALRLAGRAPVLAMDSDPAALAALERSAHAARGLKTITPRRRDLLRSPPTPAELRGFAAVAFDPPRAGARRLAEELARSAVPRLAAVSCNPATFARDARILIDGGYRLLWVQPVDQFLYAPHIELVAAFAR